MKNKVDENLSNTRWYISTIFRFKSLITQHKDSLPLRQMAKNRMGYSQEVKSSSIFFGYITHPYLKKHRIHRE